MTTARKLFALTLLAVLLVLPPPTRGAPLQLDTPPHQPAITPTAAVGTLAGQFAVNDAGSATYQIPLELPAGTKGMVPGLALTYDSAAGNGPLGVGWSLGTSTLGRCAPNLAVDGAVGPVTFTSSDPLCLDGERLVVVEGAHWKPGAVYAKRRDDLSRVRLTCTPERYRVDAFPRSRVLSAGAGPTDAAQQQSFAIDLDGDGRDDLATSSPEGLAWNVDPGLAAALRHVVFVPGTDADELPSDNSIDLEVAWSFAATDLTGTVWAIWSTAGRSPTTSTTGSGRGA